jgi:hypothetical protein
MEAEVMEREEALPVSAEGAAVANLAPQPVTASPLDLPSEVFRSGLDRRRENRGALMSWVREALIEGTDYGRIHVVNKNKCPHGNRCRNPAHFSKPSLFKPGAEKICGMLGVTVHYPTLHDYEQAALHGVALQHVIIRCEIKDASNRVVADGVGARSLKQDYGDINKALKMAEKSAHIDATLRMAGLSEVFTQDLEDMSNGKDVEEKTENAGAHPAQAGAQEAKKNQEKGEPRTISTAQHRRLEARINELKLDRERVKASRGKVEHFTELTPALYEKLDGKLEEWAERLAIQEEGAE